MNGFLWDRIKEEYKGDHANAFKLGASRETLKQIINGGMGSQCIPYDAEDVRECLEDAVSEGVMVRGVNPETNYTTFPS